MLGTEAIVTERDNRKLREALREQRSSWRTYAPILHAVENDLKQATVVPSRDVPRNVVTLDSRVRVRDMRTHRAEVWTVVLPHEACVDDGRISAFSPIGHALLGSTVGEILRLSVPGGVRTLRVENIEYQPEEAGAEEP